MTSTPRLPKRSKRFGVGKDIGGAVYVHWQYEHLLGTAVADAKSKIPKGFDYQVVKYNYQTGVVSFIQSPDFDVAPEPTVGDLMTVAADGQVKLRRQQNDPFIYHHKWLFVADDYSGFDIDASKRRSEQWTAIGNIDRARIGKKSYWEKHVLPLLDEIKPNVQQAEHKKP